MADGLNTSKKGDPKNKTQEADKGDLLSLLDILKEILRVAEIKDGKNKIISFSEFKNKFKETGLRIKNMKVLWKINDEGTPEFWQDFQKLADSCLLDKLELKILTTKIDEIQRICSDNIKRGKPGEPIVKWTIGRLQFSYRFEKNELELELLAIRRDIFSELMEKAKLEHLEEMLAKYSDLTKEQLHKLVDEVNAESTPEEGTLHLEKSGKLVEVRLDQHEKLCLRPLFLLAKKLDFPSTDMVKMDAQIEHFEKTLNEEMAKVWTQELQKLEKTANDMPNDNWRKILSEKCEGVKYNYFPMIKKLQLFVVDKKLQAEKWLGNPYQPEGKYLATEINTRWGRKSLEEVMEIMGKDYDCTTLDDERVRLVVNKPHMRKSSLSDNKSSTAKKDNNTSQKGFPIVIPAETSAEELKRLYYQEKDSQLRGMIPELRARHFIDSSLDEDYEGSFAIFHGLDLNHNKVVLNNGIANEGEFDIIVVLGNLRIIVFVEVKSKDKNEGIKQSRVKQTFFSKMMHMCEVQEEWLYVPLVVYQQEGSGNSSKEDDQSHLIDYDSLKNENFLDIIRKDGQVDDWISKMTAEPQDSRSNFVRISQLLLCATLIGCIRNGFVLESMSGVIASPELRPEDVDKIHDLTEHEVKVEKSNYIFFWQKKQMEALRGYDGNACIVGPFGCGKTIVLQAKFINRREELKALDDGASYKIFYLSALGAAGENDSFRNVGKIMVIGNKEYDRCYKKHFEEHFLTTNDLLERTYNSYGTSGPWVTLNDQPLTIIQLIEDFVAKELEDPSIKKLYIYVDEMPLADPITIIEQLNDISKAQESRVIFTVAIKSETFMYKETNEESFNTFKEKLEELRWSCAVLNLIMRNSEPIVHEINEYKEEKFPNQVDCQITSIQGTWPDLQVVEGEEDALACLKDHARQCMSRGSQVHILVDFESHRRKIMEEEDLRDSVFIAEDYSGMEAQIISYFPSGGFWCTFRRSPLLTRAISTAFIVYDMNTPNGLDYVGSFGTYPYTSSRPDSELTNPELFCSLKSHMLNIYKGENLMENTTLVINLLHTINVQGHMRSCYLLVARILRIYQLKLDEEDIFKEDRYRNEGNRMTRIEKTNALLDIEMVLCELSIGLFFIDHVSKRLDREIQDCLSSGWTVEMLRYIRRKEGIVDELNQINEKVMSFSNRLGYDLSAIVKVGSMGQLLSDVYKAIGSNVNFLSDSEQLLRKIITLIETFVDPRDLIAKLTVIGKQENLVNLIQTWLPMLNGSSPVDFIGILSGSPRKSSSPAPKLQDNLDLD